MESNLTSLDDLSAWKHLRSVIRVESKREKEVKTTFESHFYLSSLEATTKEFNQLIRNPR